MDASYVIGVLRRQHAKLEDDALISADNDLSIAIGRQQCDIRQRIQDLGDPSHARTIAQEEVVGKGRAQGLWTDEQQSGKDPRSVASLGDWELNFLSLRGDLRPSQSWYLSKPGDHFGDLGRLSLVSNESLLSSATQLTSTSQETIASKTLPDNPSLRGYKDAA
jgi:hypothetical protein